MSNPAKSDIRGPISDPDNAAARAAYVERAKTAPLVSRQVGETRHTFTARVFWPPEGYGSGDTHPTMDGALDSARASMRSGYGREPEKNVVRIIERVVTVYEVEMESGDVRI